MGYNTFMNNIYIIKELQMLLKIKKNIYARVTTKNQKEDLGNQVVFLENFANARSVIVDEPIQEIGCGLYYHLKK